jgi:hypothetical protein
LKADLEDNYLKQDGLPEIAVRENAVCDLAVS